MVRMLKKCGQHRLLPDSVQEDILPRNRGCFVYSEHTLVHSCTHKIRQVFEARHDVPLEQLTCRARSACTKSSNHDDEFRKFMMAPQFWEDKGGVPQRRIGA